MKLPCEMVQDLLPLYHDGVCSEVSNTLVGAHLETCEDCARVLKNLDVEIEVPEVEMDAARPLISIKVNWDKQNRKTLLKCIGAAVLAFAVFVGCWWGLTQWCIVPIRAEDFVILEAAQLENGIVRIEYTMMYDGTHPDMGVTEDGVLYERRLRPVLAKRREQIPSGSCGVYLDPEDLTWFDGEAYNAFCLGHPDSEEAIMVWTAGQDMPPASLASEEEYRQMLESYAAPNAPEMADRFVKHEPAEEPYHEPGENVEETVVAGTEG